MVCKMIVRDASAIIIFHAQQGLCFPIPDLFKASHSLALLLALQSLHAVLREVKIIIVIIRAAGEVVSQVILPSAVDKLCMFMLVDEERTGPTGGGGGYNGGGSSVGRIPGYSGGGGGG